MTHRMSVDGCSASLTAPIGPLNRIFAADYSLSGELS